MGHKKHRQQQHKESHHIAHSHPGGTSKDHRESLPVIELVLKCESAGSLDAVKNAILQLDENQVSWRIIHAGIGDINKTDILNAETGSRLIIGFEVNPMPQIENLVHERGVEVRLYDVIYTLIEDLGRIADSFSPREQKVVQKGQARVIALFKSSRKGIIIGCEVLQGTFTLGDTFQIFTTTGPIYQGKIQSMHINNDAVRSATQHQQVGIKITDFKKVRIGDIVETLEKQRPSPKSPRWAPTGRILAIQS